MKLLLPTSRILCIRASAVGDVLNTLPAVSAIRAAYPQSFIGYVVDERSRDLIVNHPDIDQVHFFPKKRWSKFLKNPFHWKSLFSEVRSFVREMREQHYDVSLDFQKNFKGGCIGLCAGAKTRIGLAAPWTIEGNHYFNHIKTIPPPYAIHYAEHFLALANYLHAPTLVPVHFRLPSDPKSVEKVECFIQNHSLSEFIVIHPGTSDFGKLKRWPPEYFTELTKQLGKISNLKSVITWGPSEHDLALSIVTNSQDNAILSFKTTSLLDLVELIRRAKLFIGCDSGPMHLAGAVKTPCVAIFGPKDPAIFGPYRHPSCKIVQPRDGMGATESISVDDVFKAAQSLIVSQTS